MRIMKAERLAQIKTALAGAIPAAWQTKLATRGRYVVLTIEAAPVDLLAVDRAAYGDQRVRPCVKVCPTAYETPWDEASAAIIAIWRALHTGNTVEFDRRGNRTGEYHFVELWIGEPGKPFAVSVANA